MRKLAFYSATVMTAMAMLGSVPMTSFAANVMTFGDMGNIKVLTGSLDCDINLGGSLGQIFDQIQNGLPQQPEAQSFASQVVELVNGERAKAGLAPLQVNQVISDAAELRSRELVRSFSHTRPDGSNYDSVLQENGVNYRGSGENIAYGQKTPQEVMESWMSSPGHRANILNENYTSIGVGYYQNGSTGYWTQLFTY
ncbi:MAG: CAP domain-containing protein [Lachnospiraceae bacterium]